MSLCNGDYTHCVTLRVWMVVMVVLFLICIVQGARDKNVVTSASDNDRVVVMASALNGCWELSCHVKKTHQAPYRTGCNCMIAQVGRRG